VPTLLALFGSKQGLRLPLEGRCVVGRSSEADLQLIDAGASREHCRFEVVDGRVYLEDLGSQNGTFVNGEPLAARTALAPGDEIAVGDSLLVLDGDWEMLAAKYGDARLCLGPSRAESTVLRARAGAGRGDAGAVEVGAAGGSAQVGVAVRVEELARGLEAAADRQEAAQVVLAALDAAFAPDRAFVLAADAGGEVRPLCGKSQGAAVSISRTVLRLVREDKEAVLLDDAVADPEMQKARSVVRHGLRSVMVAPIGAGPAGFLHVDRAGAGLFSEEDLALLSAMAAVVGLSDLAQRRAARPGAAGARPSGMDERAGAQLGTEDEHAGARLVGDSPAFRAALRLMDAAARVDSAVLITGESGTGKEELARALHARSGRARGPFVAVNCGAIPESLAESALFGHQKGAFTGAAANHEGYFEAADGGTLLLDEVGELAPAVQVKLLRALQERLFFRLGSTTARRSDVRVVAATHRDLEREVAAGRFREDLYFRLNVLRIHLPALRERPEDIGPLATALLARIAGRLGRPPPALGRSAEKALARWRWPGNARELGNVLERLLVLRERDDREAIDGDEVNAALGRDPAPAAAGAATAVEGEALAEKIAALEKREIEAALRRARGVKSQAARALGMSRPTLDKKIAELGIDLWADRGS
jgi:transcriptional regulator with GAF, ATPase, and Fis domain